MDWTGNRVLFQIFDGGQPHYLLEKGISELSSHLGVLLDLQDLYLHTVMYACKEVASNDEAVLGSPDRVDPTGRNQHGISRIQIHSVTFFDLFAKPVVPLIR